MIRLVVKEKKSFEVILDYNNVIDIVRLQNITVKSDYMGISSFGMGLSGAVGMLCGDVSVDS